MRACVHVCVIVCLCVCARSLVLSLPICGCHAGRRSNLSYTRFRRFNSSLPSSNASLKVRFKCGIHP